VTLILTFDLGTTYFKAALFDEQGALRALARHPADVSHPRPDRYEMSLETFRHALCNLAHELKNTFGPLDRVAAISFATQTNSFALFDARDRPLTPLILWPDARARDAIPSIETTVEGASEYAQTGVPAVGYRFSPAKLLWISRLQPDVWRSTRRLAWMGDCLALWLSGHHVTEAGAAGLTAMIDIERLCWRPDVFARLDVPPEWLPRISRAGAELGTIRPAAATDLGVPRTCRVVLGCLDQYAGAIGAGNVAPGGLSETTGTVLATVQCANRPGREPQAHVFQGPGFDPGIFFRMVFGDVSANLLERYRNSLPDKPTFDELIEAADQVPVGADGLRLVARPEQTSAAEMFADRLPRHRRGHEVRAILEAVAGALRDQVGQLTAGAAPEAIRSLGGAARSNLWRQIKADALGCPVMATACPEPTSLGAAILAAATLRGRPVADVAGQWVETLPPNLPGAGSHPATT
jgi:xylulokinase